MGSKKKHSKKRDKKKHDKKKQDKKQEQQSGAFAALNGLGADARTLGTALVGAVIGEVTEAAIARTLEKIQQRDGHQTTSRGNQEFERKTQSGGSHGKSRIKDALEVVKDVVEDVQPAVTRVVSTLQDNSGTANDVARNKVSDVLESTQATIAALKPGKKKKGKKH